MSSIGGSRFSVAIVITNLDKLSNILFQFSIKIILICSCLVSNPHKVYAFFQVPTSDSMVLQVRLVIVIVIVG